MACRMLGFAGTGVEQVKQYETTGIVRMYLERTPFASLIAVVEKHFRS